MPSIRPIAGGGGKSEEHQGPRMDYHDFQLQELFEGLCEQTLDYLGIEKGKIFLYDNFPNFFDWIDMKIEDYKQGKRITKKLDKPDEQIIRICKGYE